jgi:hypothetical protein
MKKASDKTPSVAGWGIIAAALLFGLAAKNVLVMLGVVAAFAAVVAVLDMMVDRLMAEKTSPPPLPEDRE